MAVDELLSAELAGQRAELSAVLASRGFARASALAHLLTYLCEKLFRGEAAEIKEYSIGVEVFRRGAQFDPETDSIVRVEANRLRRHLADYYEGEGASHALHIAIPVGRYVPRFEHHGAGPAEAAASSAPASHLRPTLERFKQTSRWLWMVAAVAAGLALAWAWFHARQKQAVAPYGASLPAASRSVETSFGPPPGQEVRILAGASRSLVDHSGKLWGADVWFSGGSAMEAPAQHIWRTQEQGFYRTSRQGAFRYDIPLQKGTYELRLHFAETFYGPEASGNGGEGSRIMSVRANGRVLLSGFDVVTDAGASNTADVKVFPGIEPAADGLLHLEFTAETGQRATLSAIEILPGFKARIRPVRILTRQTPYYSNDSQWWSPDVYFQGGVLASYTAPVKGNEDPELFETERWGNFSYAIPVAPGKYSVRLYFVVRHGNWNQPVAAAAESRPGVEHVFNVFCNGKLLLGQFDLRKEAVAPDVLVRRFSGLEPNAQGKLLLSFVPVRGYATVTGIEVLPQ
ncbi:MAG: malectin domain-containing carbohydrate-binding protein [Acidobacteriota bacterium]